jgi:hypothetical protein
MRAFEFLIEYESRKGRRLKKYRGGKKPPWYEEAVQLKKDNPHMTATEIGRQLNPHITYATILRWLTGAPDQNGTIYNDNPPFTSKDFPIIGSTKYFDGEKPWWYEQAIKLRKQGMMWKDIASKFSTPEERIIPQTVADWLVKGRKSMHGKLINPDALFEPRPYNTTKIDTAEIEEFIDAGLYDADIIKYIQDKKGDKIAGQVRAMLPKLRQKLNPGTEVRNKVTGDDITGLVQ